jgi:hypothetical protein
MVAVTVKADLKALRRSLLNVEKKELNTITRNTLLDTGFQTQRKLRTSTYGKAFNPRQKQFKNVITSLGTGKPARPQSGTVLKKGVARRLEIVIFDRTGKAYMERHARGGTKRPTSGSNLSIPGRDTVEPKRRGRGIPKRLRASALLATEKSFKTVVVGQPVIARRIGKKRYPIQIMHILEPSAKIRKTFDFYEDSIRSFSRRFPVNFRSNFNRRMKRVLRSRY